MSKIDSTENRFDANVGSIFGEFQLPGGLETGNPEDPEIVKTLPDDVIKDIKGEEEAEEPKEELKDAEEESEEEVEEVEHEEEEETKPKKESKKESKKVEEELEESEEAEEDVDYSYKAIAQYLAEQGVIDYEDSEDIEDSPELLENVVLQTAKNMVDEYKESIPSEAKEFLDYLERGGDPSKYLQTIQKPVDFSTIDLSDEDNQKLVLREFLASQDYSQEEIEDEIKDYEDALILEKKAKVASKKLEKVYEKKKEQLMAQQAEQEEAAKKQYSDYINSIKDTINKSSSFGGLSVSSTEKKEFEKYLLARDREGLTQYERELKDNPVQTQLELAYLKFKKFDFSKVANKAKTQETRRIKNLIKSKDTTPKGQSRKVNTSKGGDLSAFRSIY